MDLQAGTSIADGKYTLRVCLGRGSQGEVWEAEQIGLGGFSKQIVLKIMLLNAGSPIKRRELFLHEAQLAAQLNHPNIVQIYDVGEDGEIVYVAMERIYGIDLVELINSYLDLHGQPLPWHLVTRLIIDICKGLSHAHTKTDQGGLPLNLIHRDLKPENILLSADGFAKIIDFGIAKASNSANSTLPGLIKGTPGYISPEQIRSRKVDFRSDLFSLGVIFYVLCCGREPFVGKEVFSLLYSVLLEQPVAPRSINASIPSSVEEQIMKLLEKSPDMRPRNAKKLQRNLEIILREHGYFLDHEELIRVYCNVTERRIHFDRFDENIVGKSSHALDLSEEHEDNVRKLLSTYNGDLEEKIRPFETPLDEMPSFSFESSSSPFSSEQIQAKLLKNEEDLRDEKDDKSTIEMDSVMVDKAVLFEKSHSLLCSFEDDDTSISLGEKPILHSRKGDKNFCTKEKKGLKEIFVEEENTSLSFRSIGGDLEHSEKTNVSIYQKSSQSNRKIDGEQMMNPEGRSGDLSPESVGLLYQTIPSEEFFKSPSPRESYDAKQRKTNEDLDIYFFSEKASRDELHPEKTNSTIGHSDVSTQMVFSQNPPSILPEIHEDHNLFSHSTERTEHFIPQKSSLLEDEEKTEFHISRNQVKGQTLKKISSSCNKTLHSIPQKIDILEDEEKTELHISRNQVKGQGLEKISLDSEGADDADALQSSTLATISKKEKHSGAQRENELSSKGFQNLNSLHEQLSFDEREYCSDFKGELNVMGEKIEDDHLRTDVTNMSERKPLTVDAEILNSHLIANVHSKEMSFSLQSDGVFPEKTASIFPEEEDTLKFSPLQKGKKEYENLSFSQEQFYLEQGQDQHDFVLEKKNKNKKRDEPRQGIGTNRKFSGFFLLFLLTGGLTFFLWWIPQFFQD